MSPNGRAGQPITTDLKSSEQGLSNPITGRVLYSNVSALTDLPRPKHWEKPHLIDLLVNSRTFLKV